MIAGIEGLFMACLFPWASLVREPRSIAVVEEEGIRTAQRTVRLGSCSEAPGAQAMPRNARIDVEDEDHVSYIGLAAVRCIATKEHTPDSRL